MGYEQKEKEVSGGIWLTSVRKLVQAKTSAMKDK